MSVVTEEVIYFYDNRYYNLADLAGEIMFFQENVFKHINKLCNQQDFSLLLKHLLTSQGIKVPNLFADFLVTIFRKDSLIL